MAVPHPADPETQVVATIEHREIMAAFYRLSRAVQEILRLRLWEELSVAETAAVLGCSEKAASKRYLRALPRLAHTPSMSTVRRMGPHPVSRGGEK